MSELRRTGLSRNGKVILVIALVVLIGGFVAYRQSAPPSTVSAGTPLLYDDFAYTALHAEKTPQIGSQSAPTGKNFVILDVRLDNRAKRVDTKFDPSIVAVMAADGAVLRPDAKAQTILDGLVGALGKGAKTTLAAGESETYRLVFLAPANVQSFNVQFRFGAAGTFLDNLFIGKRQVAVTVDDPSPSKG